MPQRIVNLAGIGEVTVVKRRSNRHLRLSVNPRGKVRVSLPYWTPYAVGIAFAKSRSDWIIQRVAKQNVPLLYPGAKIGRLHRLYFQRQRGLVKDRTQIRDYRITVTSSMPFEDEAVQAIAYSACERALRTEATALLPPRLSRLAKSHGYRYGNLRVRKLTSRWGSCSSKNDISLSYFLVQLPADLIDYVMVHELVHTKHLHHGSDFWQAFTQALPRAKVLQRQLRSFQPRVEPQ